jgi:hypothetical protein
MSGTDSGVEQAVHMREEAINDALNSIFYRLNEYIELSEIQREARHELAKDCLNVAFCVLDMAYPSRQRAAFTPISMVRGSWEFQAEPEPPAVERWNTGCLNAQVEPIPHMTSLL